MKQDNQKIGAIIGLCTVVVTQIVLKSLGVNVFSTIVYITVFAVAATTFSFAIIKSKNKKLGIKISITAVLLMLLLSISNIIGMAIIRIYPSFGDKHEIITMIIICTALFSFLAFIIFWIIMAGKLSKEK